MNNNDIELNVSTKNLPLDYKLLEVRLLLNRKLYDNKIINFKVYNEMQEILLGRMKKIRNEYKDKQIVA